MFRISCSAMMFCRDRRDRCNLCQANRIYYSSYSKRPKNHKHCSFVFPFVKFMLGQLSLFLCRSVRNLFSSFYFTLRAVKQETTFGSRPWDLNTGTVKLLPFMNSLFSLFRLILPFEVTAETEKARSRFCKPADG